MNGSLISKFLVACLSLNPLTLYTDPFNITHPTAVQTSLFAVALFARFDPSGRYVGAGRIDGSAAIWDLETRAPVRWLDGHVKTVTAVEYVLYFQMLYDREYRLEYLAPCIALLAVGQDILAMC